MDKLKGLIKKFSGSDRRVVSIAVICGVLLLGIVVLALSGRGTGDEPADGMDAADMAQEAAVRDEDPMDPAGFRMAGFDEALISYLNDNGHAQSSFVVSPAALRSSLCAAAAGAQGNTRTELAAAAGFPGMEALDAWRSGLEDAAGGRVAVSVWADEDMIGKFTDSYAAKAKDSYGADAVSYGSEGPGGAMDAWIASRTGGAIGAIARDLDGASSALISAMDMRTAWLDAFEEVPGSDLMERTGECWYAEGNGTRAVAIPMDGGLTFVCFTGSRTGMFGRIADMRKDLVHVVLPAFSLESAFDGRDLGGFLLSRGVSEAMDPMAANFYNMCRDSDWFLQEIVQQARFEAGAQGAGTADGAEPAGNAEAEEFIADGPCSFAVFAGFGTDSQYMLLYGQLAR